MASAVDVCTHRGSGSTRFARYVSRINKLALEAAHQNAPSFSIPTELVADAAWNRASRRVCNRKAMEPKNVGPAQHWSRGLSCVALDRTSLLRRAPGVAV